MSMGKGVDRLRTLAGANMAESIRTDRPAGAVGPAIPAAALRGATDGDRYQGINRVRGAFHLPIERIVPDPEQPRKEFDPESVKRLAGSLRDRGQVQPIRVRWDGDLNRWVIIAGERRWRAAQLAGIPTLAAVEAMGEITPDDVLEEQLIENCMREDLKPIEQAHAFRALMDRRGWSAIRLAQALNLNDSTVIRALALLDLPCTVQDKVEAGQLAPSVAYEISKIEDPDQQHDLATRVVEEGLNRSETIQAVRQTTGRVRGARSKGSSKGRKVASRIFRTATAKVTIELRRGSGDGAIVTALREVLQQAEARLSAGDQTAA